jgi:biopolymer transport protein ExbB
MLQLNLRPRRAARLAYGWLALVLMLAYCAAVQAQSPTPAKADAKPAAGSSAAASAADEKFNQDLGVAEKEAAARKDAKPADQESISIPAINLWDMFRKGGILMYPITLMSLVVVAFTIERAIGLRRKKVIPHGLVKGLGDLADSPNGFDPRRAYRICQQFPCSASNVVRAVLLKVGRPLTEVERAAAESSSRESWKLNCNIRPLALAVTVTPLIGLLGTLQGMIIVFFRFANSPAGEDRVMALSDGIYLKLITAFAGLVVAVPALFAAHYFEGRVQSLMHEVDDLVQSFLPQVEKYEGRLRVSRQSMGRDAGATVEPPPVARYAPSESVSDAAVQVEGA